MQGRARKEGRDALPAVSETDGPYQQQDGVLELRDRIDNRCEMFFMERHDHPVGGRAIAASRKVT